MGSDAAVSWRDGGVGLAIGALGQLQVVQV